MPHSRVGNLRTIRLLRALKWTLRIAPLNIQWMASNPNDSHPTAPRAARTRHTARIAGCVESAAPPAACRRPRVAVLTGLGARSLGSACYLSGRQQRRGSIQRFGFQIPNRLIRQPFAYPARRSKRWVNFHTNLAFFHTIEGLIFMCRDASCRSRDRSA